jgi:RimJ/RimL family protein N-acetyltransferase
VTASSEPHPATGQPVGPTVDATPAQRPGPLTLEGRYGRIERLAQHHDRDLWDAVRGHDPIWTYMSGYGPFADFATFSQWIGSRLPLDDPYSYAIVEPSGRAVGIATLMEIKPAARSIEVGHIEWKCNALNEPSRRAALRYGFVYEGTLRQAMIAKGRNRDTAYFSMLDSEWPARKAAFESWLAPENFDGQGRQKIKLGRKP